MVAQDVVDECQYTHYTNESPIPMSPTIDFTESSQDISITEFSPIRYFILKNLIHINTVTFLLYIYLQFLRSNFNLHHK